MERTKQNVAFVQTETRVCGGESVGRGCSSAAFLVLFLGPEGPPDRQVQITSFALCFQPISRGHAVCGGSGMTCTIPVLSNSGSTSDFERS